MSPTPTAAHVRQGVPPHEHIRYVGGSLRCEGVSLEDIADGVGTPAYVYSAATIDAAYASVARAMRLATDHGVLVAYAVKANANLSILARLARAGCGADIVSGGELMRALKAGVDPKKIVFSGVGKRRDEIHLALEHEIRAIHVESVPELDVIEDEAKRRGAPARIALRINPNVDARTHPYIATGLHDTKFGLEVDVARSALGRIVASPHLVLDGVACHIGSQLESPAPLREAVGLLARFAVECRAAGAPVSSLDVGGGWPMPYGSEASPYPSFDDFGRAIAAGLRDARVNDVDLVTEPGRAIAGSAGVLLTRVLYVKHQRDKRFVIVDAAMTELIRPALYQAYHAVVPAREVPSRLVPCDVVGPVCESGDFLALGRNLPDSIDSGALLVVLGAGAYGREMASTYNARPLVPEVLVEGASFRTVRRRAPIDSLWAFETL